MAHYTDEEKKAIWEYFIDGSGLTADRLKTLREKCPSLAEKKKTDAQLKEQARQLKKKAREKITKEKRSAITYTFCFFLFIFFLI